MRPGAIIILALLSTLSMEAAAQEFFGEFAQGPQGQFVDADPRPVFRLETEFSFLDPNGLEWLVPDGTEVDGASIPQAFWSVIGGPFSGKYIRASVVHDHYCRTKERTAHDTHRNFYYGMRAAGVARWQAEAMYWAVSAFGPSWKLERRIAQRPICNATAEGMTCTLTAVQETNAVASPSVDLEDPEVLAIALGKFAAVARTLRTTDGETLDVTPFGNIEGSLGSIEENANRIRDSLTAGTYEVDPAALGVLSEWHASTLDEIAEWPDGELPSYSAVPNLGSAASAGPEGSAAFKLLPGEAAVLQESLDLAPSTFQLQDAVRAQ